MAELGDQPVCSHRPAAAGADGDRGVIRAWYPRKRCSGIPQARHRPPTWCCRRLCGQYAVVRRLVTVPRG
jgi:hypothetical protein